MVKESINIGVNSFIKNSLPRKFFRVDKVAEGEEPVLKDYPGSSSVTRKIQPNMFDVIECISIPISKSEDESIISSTEEKLKSKLLSRENAIFLNMLDTIISDAYHKNKGSSFVEALTKIENPVVLIYVKNLESFDAFCKKLGLEFLEDSYIVHEDKKIPVETYEYGTTASDKNLYIVGDNVGVFFERLPYVPTSGTNVKEGTVTYGFLANIGLLFYSDKNVAGFDLDNA